MYCSALRNYEKGPCTTRTGNLRFPKPGVLQALLDLYPILLPNTIGTLLMLIRGRKNHVAAGSFERGASNLSDHLLLAIWVFSTCSFGSTCSFVGTTEAASRPRPSVKATTISLTLPTRKY